MAATVVLVGGPPGAGKTTLARGLAGRLGHASTSVDDFALVAAHVTDPGSFPALHPMRGVGHVDYFTAGPTDRLIADAQAQAAALWPAVERVIIRHRTGGLPVVLDWWLFAPRDVAGLGDGVDSVWLTIDPEVLDARERALEDFRAGSSDPEAMHAHFMARSRWRNDLVARQATGAGLPVVHQDGTKSVDDVVDEAIARLGG